MVGVGRMKTGFVAKYMPTAKGMLTNGDIIARGAAWESSTPATTCKAVPAMSHVKKPHHAILLRRHSPMPSGSMKREIPPSTTRLSHTSQRGGAEKCLCRHQNSTGRHYQPTQNHKHSQWQNRHAVGSIRSIRLGHTRGSYSDGPNRITFNVGTRENSSMSPVSRENPWYNAVAAMIMS